MTLRGLRKIILVIREIRVRKPYASHINMTLRVLRKIIRVIRVQRPKHHALTMIPVFSETIRVIREIRVQKT